VPVKFEYLEHPADIGFRAHGKDLPELFANCAHALISIILDPTLASEVEQWELGAEGIDPESLLVNWLNEVLYYVDTKRVVFTSFAIEFPDPLRLRCTALGEVRDRVKHPVRIAVKAVTYHQLRVSKNQDLWDAEVYVDV
jgi:SHS2 domain-containing protein